MKVDESEFVKVFGLGLSWVKDSIEKRLGYTAVAYAAPAWYL